jgi:hypothetical protein
VRSQVSKVPNSEVVALFDDLAGASAMLKYLTRDPTNGLFELGEVIWLETAMRTLELSLAKIARGSRLAQAA